MLHLACFFGGARGRSPSLARNCWTSGRDERGGSTAVSVPCRHAVAAKSVPGWLVLCISLMATLSALAPQRCAAQDEAPSIVGYAFEGMGTGLTTGLALGYIAT